MAPLPQTQAPAAPASGGDLQRIAPLDQDPKAAAILTTKPVPTAPAQAPTNASAAAPVAAPFVKPATAPTAPAPFNMGKTPFAHAAPLAPEVPSGPHATVATPVVNVDAVETTEPAPPTPPAAGTNPATEDPAAPTEFSSPIFDNTTDSGAPRKIVIRVLNKVTAQSALFKAKPGETIQFGRLQIIAEICRISAPNSQTDSAGLLDIKEKLPGKEGIKPLFHGWMYSSSPSITGLEHPIYDVTMINCDIATPPPKEEPKPAKKPANSKKK